LLSYRLEVIAFEVFPVIYADKLVCGDFYFWVLKQTIETIAVIVMKILIFDCLHCFGVHGWCCKGMLFIKSPEQRGFLLCNVA